MKKRAAKATTAKIKAGSDKASASARRTLFVEAYLSNGNNATQAAISSGLSPATAGSTGQRMLKHAEVQQKLAERQQQLAQKFSLRTEDVIRSLSQALYFDPRKLYRADGSLKPIHELDDDTAAGLAGLEVVEMAGGAKITTDGGIQHVAMYTKKVKWLDKNVAREQAIKHLGLYERDNEQSKSTAQVIVVPAKDAA